MRKKKYTLDKMNFLFYCRLVMRKMLSYILILAFVTSIFDVLDVNDIRLGNREIFSTTDANADNDCDDLHDQGLNYSTVASFAMIMPRELHFEFDVAAAEKPIHTFHNKQRIFMVHNNLYRPPII